MNPNLIVDCSVAMAWCFVDEATKSTNELLERLADEAALVPALWHLEITNVLALAEKKNRINKGEVDEFISLLESLEIEADEESSNRAFHHLLPLCRTYQLTSYDATYLDLAVRRKLPLASLDEPLRKAAKKLGVKLLGK
jgi:predicted nucleic acid-binding protein